MIGATIDGSSITEFCQEIRWRPRWNQLHSAVIRFPGPFLSVAVGQELTLSLGGTIFQGEIWETEASGEPDAAYVEATAWDWSIWLRKRMCRQGPSDPDPGNMVDLKPVIDAAVTGPEIAAAFVQNSIDYDPTFPFGNAPPVVIGTVETGGVDLTSVPMAFPMTIDRMFTLLASTGQLVVERLPGPAGSTLLNFLNPYTNDVSGSVVYGYGGGSFNSQVAQHTRDADDIANAIWYLVGRRRSDGRWPGSITATAPSVGGSWPTDLLDRVYDSRTQWGYAQEIQILDDTGDENDIRDMFEERWANEAWVRAQPREFGSVMPQRGTVPNFALGDIIGVQGGSMLNGGFTGDQRAYGWDISCDADGVISWDDITTSADQEGAVPVG